MNDTMRERWPKDRVGELSRQLRDESIEIHRVKYLSNRQLVDEALGYVQSDPFPAALIECFNRLSPNWHEYDPTDDSLPPDDFASERYFWAAMAVALGFLALVFCVVGFLIWWPR
jgi:hypothetical protein